VVSPVMGRPGCPGREKDCIKHAGTGVELALAYTMIRIYLEPETGPGRVAGANTGTREQWRELALAYMWRIHMETGPRRVEEAIAGTAQIHCGRRMTPACR